MDNLILENVYKQLSMKMDSVLFLIVFNPLITNYCENYEEEILKAVCSQQTKQGNEHMSSKESEERTDRDSIVIKSQVRVIANNKSSVFISIYFCSYCYKYIDNFVQVILYIC